MFSSLKRVVGNITVTEHNGIIRVEGIPAETIERDIKRIYKTSKIGDNLFTRIGYSYFEFYSFFAIEVVYLINNIINNPRTISNVRSLNKILNAIYENTWLKQTKNENIPGILNFKKLNLFNLQPKDYQLNFLHYFDSSIPRYNLCGSLLQGTPGSGKTFMNLALVEASESDYAIIICQKRAIQTAWVSDINKIYKTPPSYFTSDSSVDYNGQKYLIIHEEAIGDIFDYINRFKPNSKVFLGLDESHFFTNMDTARTTLFIKICNEIKSKFNSLFLFSSGTAFKAEGKEAIPLLTVIDNLFNEQVSDSFKSIFGKDANKGNDILKNRLGIVLFNIGKEELGLTKPLIQSFTVEVPNSEKYTLDQVKIQMQKFIQEKIQQYSKSENEDYNFFISCIEHRKEQLVNNQKQIEILDDYVNKVKEIRTAYDKDIKNLKTVKDIIQYCNTYEKENIIPFLTKEQKSHFLEIRSLIKYPLLKIQGECLGLVLGKLRIECITDMARVIDYDKYINSTLKKTIVFTSYVQALEAARDTLADKGYKPIAVYGKTNHELTDMINSFKNNNELNPCIATYMSLSDSVPMTMANVIIEINVPFRQYVQTQAISRIDRLGQDSPTFVYIASLYTNGRDNLSTRDIDIMEWSRKEVEAFTGIEAPYTVTQALEGYDDNIDNLDDNHVSEYFISSQTYGIEIPIETVYQKPLTHNFFNRW